MHALPSVQKVAAAITAAYERDVPTNAMLVAHLVAYMRHFPRLGAPEVFLAQGIAEITSQHLFLLCNNSTNTGLPISLEQGYMARVQYANVRYGTLFARSDTAYSHAHSEVEHIADTCAWLIHCAQCDMVLQGMDLTLIEPLQQRIARLTPKERLVLQILTRGGSIAEMAQEANIAEGTFRSHLGRIYSKLEVKGQRDAIVRGTVAQMMGLL